MATGQRPENFIETETFMGRIAHYISEQGDEHPTRTNIIAKAGGYRGRLGHALDMLIANGYVGVYKDERHINRHHVLVDFIEGESKAETTPPPGHRTTAGRLLLKRGASPRENIEHLEAVHLQTVTKIQRDRFLHVLREGWSVTLAAREIPATRATVMRWCDTDPEFYAAMKEAQAEGIDRLEDEAHRRGVKGVPKPVFYQGKRVATVREYSDTMLLASLKANRPEKYRDRKEWWRQDEAAETAAARTPSASELEQIRKDGLDADFNEAFDMLAKVIGKRERERRAHIE